MSETVAKALNVIFLPLYSIPANAQLEGFLDLVNRIIPDRILDTRQWPKSRSPDFSWSDLNTLRTGMSLVSVGKKKKGAVTIDHLPELGAPQSLRPRINQPLNHVGYADYLDAQSQTLTTYFNAIVEDKDINTILVLTVDPIEDRDQRRGIQSALVKHMPDTAFDFQDVNGGQARVPTMQDRLTALQTSKQKLQEATLRLIVDLQASEGYAGLPETIRARVEKAEAVVRHA